LLTLDLDSLRLKSFDEGRGARQALHPIDATCGFARAVGRRRLERFSSPDSPHFSEPTLRSAPPSHSANSFVLRFAPKARGISPPIGYGGGSPTSTKRSGGFAFLLENRCGEFQIERPPDKKSGSMVVALHTRKTSYGKYLEKRRVSSSAACRLCLDAGFT